MPGRFAALVLSRGEQFEPAPLTPRSHGYTSWPSDGVAYTIFYDTAGGEIARIYGEVTTEMVTFDSPPEQVDIVPAGAPYETFLIDDDGKPRMIRYGRVVRKQAQFFDSVARNTSTRALQFRDDFYKRTGRVGSKWFVTYGRPTIFAHTGGDPNGVGPHSTFFADAAMRYFAPLNSDSPILSFNLLHRGAGDTAIICCSDAAMKSYLYVQFRDPGIFEGGVDKVRMGIGHGPISPMVQKVAEVNHTVVDNTNYKLRYDDLTKRLSLFNSDMTTEIIGFTDDNEELPHGPGYRYFGANFQASIFDTGHQLTSISAQDALNAD